MEQASFDLSTEHLAKRILSEVMIYRRTTKAHDLCDHRDCSECYSLHLPKIVSAVEKNEAIPFVLPAFPGKSPNPHKVLGTLPDFAEILALRFLGTLARKIREFYAPGIHVIICSDGRVFSDVVGMREEDVTSYQNELSTLIKDLSLSDMSTFNLDDVYDESSFEVMRSGMMKSFGVSTEALKEKVRIEEEAKRMYCGIARFLFEDALHPGQQKSRAAVQKESRVKAYEVIRRSNAWSELIAQRFPQAVRLSIHPQVCGSPKIGIRLIGDESWMTPWHGVAVETHDGFVLMKRSEAEALGARMVHFPDRRPSHYKLIPEN